MMGPPPIPRSEWRQTPTISPLIVRCLAGFPPPRRLLRAQGCPREQATRQRYILPTLAARGSTDPPRQDAAPSEG